MRLRLSIEIFIILAFTDFVFIWNLVSFEAQAISAYSALIFVLSWNVRLLYFLQVAVKIIDKKKSREDSYVRKNLRREGKILQMIRHSNIVQLLEIMETQNSYYLVTELCRGGDLMDYISQRRKLPEQEVKKYIRQIVSAVDYLHRLGILHR